MMTDSPQTCARQARPAVLRGGGGGGGRGLLATPEARTDHPGSGRLCWRHGSSRSPCTKRALSSSPLPLYLHSAISKKIFKLKIGDVVTQFWHTETVIS